MTWTVTVTPLEAPDDFGASTERCAEVYRAYRRAVADDAIALDPVPVTYRGIEQFDVGAEDGVPETLASTADALAERRELLEQGLPTAGAIRELIKERIAGSKLVLAAPGPTSLARALRERFDERVHVGTLRGADDDPDRVEAFIDADGPALLVAAPSHLAAGPAIPPSAGVVALGTLLTAPTVLDVLGSTIDLDDRESFSALVAIPAGEAERLSGADGRAFLEAAARLRASGHDHGQSVRFTATDRRTETAAIALANDGAVWIRRLHELRRFAWPSDPVVRAALRAFLRSIDDGGAGVLGRWAPPATSGTATDADEVETADDGRPDRIPDPERADRGSAENGEETSTDGGGERPALGTDRFRRRQGTFERRRRTARRSWHHYEPDARDPGPVSLEAIEAVIEENGTAAGRSTDRPSEDPLLEELRELAAVLGRPPRPRDVNKFGTRSPRAYTERFGSWGAALEAADIGSGNESADGRGIGGLLARSVGTALRRLSPL